MSRLQIMEIYVLKWIFGEIGGMGSARLTEALLSYFYPHLYAAAPKCPFCNKVFRTKNGLKVHLIKSADCGYQLKLVVLDLCRKQAFVKKYLRNDRFVKICYDGHCRSFRNYREALEHLFQARGNEIRASTLAR